MPLATSLLNLSGFVIDQLNGINPVQLVARFVGKILCPRCGSQHIRKKTSFVRRIRHESFGTRRCEILLKSHKFHCKSCLRYFNQRFPGILKWHRSTEAFRKEVFQKHHLGFSQLDLTRTLHIGSATVERWYHSLLKKKVLELQDQHFPKYLGIDEHFFSKKYGFVTTLCSLDRNRILDILPGKSKDKIFPHLKKINGRHSVQMICMDLSDHYRSIAKHFFPNARIVADRFHVIRLVNHHFLKTWHLLDPNAKYSRGLLSLMRRHQWHLSDQQSSNLISYLRQVPGLEPIYLFKQKLVRLLLKKSLTQSQAKRLIPLFLRYIHYLKTAHFEPLVTLGFTLDHWQEEIATMWRFSKSNSITEGFHRKMKLIQRRAYGFKNFENYRLRVRALCC